MILINRPWNNVGIGNHFFIYAYARLLAEKLNYKLKLEENVKIHEHNIGDPTSYSFRQLDGRDYSHNGSYTIEDGFAVQKLHIDNVVKFFTDKSISIISNGYYQKCSYWYGYEKTIKSYFSDLVYEYPSRSDKDIAIHLRSSNKDHRFKLSPKYYTDCLNQMSFKNLFVFADDFSRHKDTIDQLKKYKPKLMYLNYLDSIKEISSFDKIILSQGSSSFWMGFLSKAKTIIIPVTDFNLISIPENEKIRSSKSHETLREVDYYINDSRYTYIDLRNNDQKN